MLNALWLDNFRTREPLPTWEGPHYPRVLTYAQLSWLLRKNKTTKSTLLSPSSSKYLACAASFFFFKIQICIFWKYKIKTSFGDNQSPLSKSNPLIRWAYTRHTLSLPNRFSGLSISKTWFRSSIYSLFCKWQHSIWRNFACSKWF